MCVCPIGQGTRFKVYLPATASLLPDTPIAKPELPLGNGELILVVDDELSVQEVTQATLETYGYRTLAASDGIEAIALYAEHKQEIRVILLDQMMPSLDAATTVRTLYKLNPAVKIVAMSGLATNETVLKDHIEGVQAFLAKPFTAPELLKLLHELCSN